jgi:hypothetical protein
LSIDNPFSPGRLSDGYVSTLMRVQLAFEQAGIRFIDNESGGGIGVQLAAPDR